jgi:hypothetical protein
MRLLCAIAVCSVIIITRSSARAADATPAPPPGWMGAEQYSKALALAKKNGQPLAIFFTYGSTKRYFGRGRDFGNFILSQQGLHSMVRVMVFAENTPDFLQDIRGKTGDTTGFMPQLYLLDPRGDIAGYAASGDRALVVKSIKVVNDLAIWLKRSDRLLESADKGALTGRYNAALRVVEQIDLDDRKMTAAVAAVVPQPAQSATTQPASGAVTSDPFARPGDAAPVAQEIQQPAPQPKELPPGKFFPDLVMVTQAKYKAEAADRLAAAKDAFEQKQYTAAMRTLSPMVEDHADFDAVKQAADLLTKIEAAEREADKAPAN